jgi:hypothetical protein
MEASTNYDANQNNISRRVVGTLRDRVFLDSTKLYNPNPRIGLYGYGRQKIELAGGDSSITLEATDNSQTSFDSLSISCKNNQDTTTQNDFETRPGVKYLDCKELIVIADKIVFNADITINGNLTLMGDLKVLGIKDIKGVF